MELKLQKLMDDLSREADTVNEVLKSKGYIVFFREFKKIKDSNNYNLYLKFEKKNEGRSIGKKNMDKVITKYKKELYANLKIIKKIKIREENTIKDDLGISYSLTIDCLKFEYD